MKTLKMFIAFCIIFATVFFYFQFNDVTSKLNGVTSSIKRSNSLRGNHSNRYFHHKKNESRWSGNYSNRHLHHEKNQSIEKEAIERSPALYYCNFPSVEDKRDVNEGIPPTKDSVLKQVQVVIRHGDRSPMADTLYKKLGVKPVYCNVKLGIHSSQDTCFFYTKLDDYNAEKSPTHALLQSFIEDTSSDLEQLKKEHKVLYYHPFPNYDICGSAQLSQLGVVQHLQNGKLLRESYSEFFTKVNELRSTVYAVTTKRTRTVQSLIAFLYGLLPNFHLNQVPLMFSASDLFRTSGCNSAALMQQSVNKMRYAVYVERQKGNTAFRKLADTFDINDHSGVLIDSFITGFLCKRIELPCVGENCAKLDDLDTVMTEENFMMKKVVEETTFVNQSLLNIHPLLTQIVTAMKQKVMEKQSKNVLTFSGHDTTLKPLIAALGIPDMRWPKLGTRLVFELWQDVSDDKHLVRILLNGKDHTLQTRFCSKLRGVCTFEEFQRYVNVDILRRFNSRTWHEACAVQ